MPKYLYVNRPPGISCQPKGFDPDTCEAWIPHREVNGRPFWGRVEYPEPLPWKTVWQFELYPEDELERAEMVFSREGGDAAWLREDYLDTPIDELQSGSDFGDPKCWAALVILKHEGLKEA